MEVYNFQKKSVEKDSQIFEFKKFESKQNIRFSKNAHAEQYDVRVKSQMSFKSSARLSD